MNAYQLDSVESLSNVLENIDDVQSQRNLTNEQRRRLDKIGQGCHNVLKELKKILDECQELDSSAKNTSGKLRRVWKRFQWNQENIDELRTQIILNINALSAFLAQIIR